MTSPSRRCRAGTAIVAALALVALAGALLTIAAANATAGTRAAAAERTALVVEGVAVRALAEVLVDWPSAVDSLPEGAFGDRALVVRPGAAPDGPALAGRLRVQRTGPTLFCVTVEVRAASSEAATAVARRRMRLVVRRGTPPDTGGARAVPVLIARWPVADLY